MCCPAAVDAKHRAGGVAGRVAGEVDRRTLNFLQLAPTLERRRPNDEFFPLLGVGDRHIHRRQKRAGADCVHRDAAAGQFQRQRTGELYCTALAGRVRGSIRDCHQPKRTRHVDDAPEAALLHVRQHRPAGQPDAIDIDPLHLGELLIAQLIDWPARVDTGAVDEDVHLAKRIDRRRGHRLHLRLTRHIGRVAKRLAPELLRDSGRRRLGLGLVAADQHQIRACAGQAGRHGLAQSFRPAGDHRGLATQIKPLNSRKHDTKDSWPQILPTQPRLAKRSLRTFLDQNSAV